MISAENISHFPSSPGVYLMRGSDGTVLYVGKARSLRQRVRSYFRQSGDSRYHIPFLMARVAAIDYIVTDTEKEALILENTLIKEHRPRYNFNLRDDKTYFSLRLDMAEEFPRLAIVRKVPRDGARYSAPCYGLISREDYAALACGVALFLEGKNRELLQVLKQRMAAAAAAEQFEEAARFRNLIRSIEITVERQKMVIHGGDTDVIGFFRAGNRMEIAILFIRGGSMIGNRSYSLAWELDDAEGLASFLNEYYGRDVFIPEELLLPLPLPEHGALAELLTERRGKRVTVTFPRRGVKAELVALADRNAATAAAEK